MQTEHIFVIWRCLRIKDEVRTSKPGLRLQKNVSTDLRSMAVPLLQFFFVCASVISYVAFVLSLFVPQLFFCWFLGRALLRDCDIF